MWPVASKLAPFTVAFFDLAKRTLVQSATGLATMIMSALKMEARSETACAIYPTCVLRILVTPPTTNAMVHSASAGHKRL